MWKAIGSILHLGPPLGNRQLFAVGRFQSHCKSEMSQAVSWDTSMYPMYSLSVLIFSYHHDIPELVIPCFEVHFTSLSQVLFWSGEDQGVWGPGELQMRDSGYLVFGGQARAPHQLPCHHGLHGVQVMPWTRALETSGW